MKADMRQLKIYIGLVSEDICSKPNVSNTVQARCRNVIYSILDPNPTRRITASQVLKSEWGREIKVCKSGEEGTFRDHGFS